MERIVSGPTIMFFHEQFQKHKKTQEIKEMMARLLLLLADYEDVELVMYPRTMNLRTKFDTLGKGFSPDSQAIGAYYAKETVTLLEREGQVYRPSFILGIKVKEKQRWRVFMM